MKYKEYLITEFVNDKGQWQAHIPRRGRQTHERGGNDNFPYSPPCTQTRKTRQSELQKRQSIRERFQRPGVEQDVEIAATLLQVVAER
jgi:hypothetical protein